jgi:hypothetical protein
LKAEEEASLHQTMKQLFHLQSSYEGCFERQAFQNLMQGFQHEVVQKSPRSEESHLPADATVNPSGLCNKPIDKVKEVLSYKNKFSSNFNLTVKVLGNQT